MTAHVAQCVAMRDDVPGTVTYVYRCCGDPRTDSRLDIANPHTVDIDYWKVYHQDKVQKIHARKQDAVAQIEALQSAPATAAVDGAGGSHSVEILDVDGVDSRMLADDVVWIRYRCCGQHEHLERIHRIWHGMLPHVNMQPTSKTTADILAEIVQHRTNAAMAHANAIVKKTLHAQAEV
jgi:hypothetical protein